MSKRHGKSGALYVDPTGSAAASPVAYLNDWSINFSTDKVDVTAMNDTNKNYASGLPDVQGTFAGFWDDASVQLYTAASDGAARKFYLYPDRSNAAGVYWFGTAIFDFDLKSSVTAAVEMSGTFAAASSVAKVG